ncbi:MAG: cell wall surface anchor family protein [Candidatus Peregrinibacteria bacterium Greene1014_49]|nr:MAG: cell wall surface anchor family protein [Candidatus Peregrinibacteria bacterium Greene1014_49]
MRLNTSRITSIIFFYRKFMRTHNGRCSLERLALRASATITLAALLFVSSADIAFAATRYWVGKNNTAADYTRWESLSNWSATSGGATGATIPTAADIAIFDSKGGRNAEIRSNVSVLGLVITSSSTGSILQGTGRLAIGTSGWRVGSGRFIGGNAPIALSGSYTQTGGIVTGLMHTLAVSGSLSITKVGTYSTFTSTGTIVLDGNADQNFTVGANVTKSFKNLTIRNVGTGTSDDIVVDVNGGLFLSGALTITQGNLDLSTNDMALVTDRGITLADSSDASLTTDSNVTASGTILVNDAATITVTAGTWTLNDRGDQDVDLDGQSLYNLTINNNGGGTDDDIVIAGGTLAVSNDLVVTLGNLDLVTNALSLDVNDDVTIAGTAQATLAGGTMNIGGDLTLNTNGSFSQNTGTATFDGTSQTISGSLVFLNLTKDTATSDTLTFSTSDSITVSNSITLYGSAGSTLSIRSSVAGTRWNLQAPSTQTVAGVDVKDSRVTNSSNSMVCKSRCVDSGNNLNWVLFATATTTTTSDGSTGGTSGSGGGGRRSGSGGGGTTSTTKATTEKKVETKAKATPDAKGGPEVKTKTKVQSKAAERKAARAAKVAPAKSKAATRAAARRNAKK